MHTITLDGSETYTVPDAVFAQIQKLVAQNSVCRLCEKSFDEKANPMVANSFCLECFLRENSSLNLESTPRIVVDKNGKKAYRLLDQEGYVYTPSPETESIEAYENIPLTLAFWDFPDVDTIELEGKPVELDPLDASIFGDLRKNSVVVVSKRKMGGRIEVTFLAYKHGACVYLDKAKGPTRKIWRETESQYLATRDTRGRYHYKDRTSRQPLQSDIYCLLSDNESAKSDQEKEEA